MTGVPFLRDAAFFVVAFLSVVAFLVAATVALALAFAGALAAFTALAGALALAGAFALAGALAFAGLAALALAGAFALAALTGALAFAGAFAFAGLAAFLVSFAFVFFGGTVAYLPPEQFGASTPEFGKELYSLYSEFLSKERTFFMKRSRPDPGGKRGHPCSSIQALRARCQLVKKAHNQAILDSSTAAASGRPWLTETARQHVLAQVSEAAKAAQHVGVRPRLVIFDYTDTPVAGQLRAMAQDLNMLVGVEPFERRLPSASLRDRFRILEKSKGIHGIFFPAAMTDSHRACLEAHPTLRALALDRGQDKLSPQVVSFLQLAAVQRWNPEGREAAVVHAEATRAIARTLALELEGLGMKVRTLLHPQELSGALACTSVVWLCHGRPLSLSRLHLPADAVLIDAGRALEIPASFSAAQARLLPHRVRGFCPADGGFSTLVNLNRIQRLLLRALGPRRPRSASFSAARQLGAP